MRKNDKKGKKMAKKKPAKITKPLEFQLKTTSIERVLIVIMSVLFGLTLIYDHNMPLLIIFYVIATGILLYYFIVYRSKPPYVRINADSVTVHSGFLFKEHTMLLKNIKTVLNEKGKIEVFQAKGDPIMIRTMLLENTDAEMIESILTSYAG